MQAILRKRISAERVVMRDAKSYCAMLLDDNNRKPICRFWLEGKAWYIGLFDREKNVERVPISTLEEI